MKFITVTGCQSGLRFLFFFLLLLLLSPSLPGASTYTVCGGFSFGTCKPVVMCTFHSDSDSFKQRLKKKKKSPSASWSLHKCSSLSVCRAWEIYLFFGFRGGGGDLRRRLDACRDITEQHVTGRHVIPSPQVVFLSSLLSFTP